MKKKRFQNFYTICLFFLFELWVLECLKNIDHSKLCKLIFYPNLRATPSFQISSHCIFSHPLSRFNDTSTPTSSQFSKYEPNRHHRYFPRIDQSRRSDGQKCLNRVDTSICWIAKIPNACCTPRAATFACLGRSEQEGKGGEDARGPINRVLEFYATHSRNAWNRPRVDGSRGKRSLPGAVNIAISDKSGAISVGAQGHYYTSVTLCVGIY